MVGYGVPPRYREKRDQFMRQRGHVVQSAGSVITQKSAQVHSPLLAVFAIGITDFNSFVMLLIFQLVRGWQ